MSDDHRTHMDSLSEPESEVDHVDYSFDSDIRVPGSTSTASRPWVRESWQVPVVVGAIVAILAAVWYRNAGVRTYSNEQVLAAAESRIEAGQFSDAGLLLDELSTRIESEEPMFLSRYHVARGDVLLAEAPGFDGMRGNGCSGVLDEYAAAKTFGWVPNDARRLGIAESLIRCGEIDGAVVELEYLAQVEVEDIASKAMAHHRQIIRRRIEADQARGAESGKIFEQLDAFVALKPAPAEETWALETRTREELAIGQHDGITERLILGMRRLEGIDDGEIDWARMHVLLGQTYRVIGKPELAKERFNYALEELKAYAQAKGTALRYLGDISLLDGNVQDSESFFRQAMDTVGVHAVDRDMSELGLARSLARRGAHDEAVAVFTTALNRPGFSSQVSSSRLAESLQDEGRQAILLAGDKPAAEARILFAAAVSYGGLAVQAANDESDRRDALRLQGVASFQYARALLQPHIDLVDPREAEFSRVPLTVRMEANRHFVDAGNAYLELEAFAELEPQDAGGRLVWDVATAFDMGGRPEEAISFYTRYINEQPLDDDRRPEALYRLAVAHHAAQNQEDAIAWYRLLISDSMEADSGNAQSRFTTAARVRLAQCLVNADSPHSENYTEAESHLRDIHEGRGGVGPDAPEYRDAMFQLGRVLVMQERWLEATEVIEGGLRRYPEDQRVPEFSTLGGIARMSHAEFLADQLQSSNVSTSREGIEEARSEAIRIAVDLFDRSIQLLDVPGEKSLTPLEDEYLRSAYMERAAAYAALNQYQVAIDSYWDIERRFGEDVTAIESLIRISNLATTRGDDAEADRAMSRVLVLLRRSTPGGAAGPDLLEDIDSGTLQQWITLQPPGEEGVSP